MDFPLPPRDGGISMVNPYTPWRDPGPERGHIKGQAIYFLTGPWPREGAYQKSNHIFLDGALDPRGGRFKGQAMDQGDPETSWTRVEI